MGGSKVECFVKEILANGRIEFFDIKANEVRVLFSLSGVKPVDYRCSVFPLVKVAFTASFRHAKLRNSTELSKHIWTLKDNCIDHFISWCILSSHSPYSSASKRCNLCLKEKFLIICQPDLSTLNKRNELVSSCRHRNKALLRNS